MILRAAALGFAYWFLCTLALRLFGDVLAPLGQGQFALLFGAVMVGVPLITFASLKFVRVARGDEAEAAISIAFPGMLLNAILMQNFDAVFPMLNSDLGFTFGAASLVGYGAMIFSGLMFTKLAPEEEGV
jgi:hypothetical protein